MSKVIICETVSINELDNTAKSIISILENKDICVLGGDLGFGKTTLVRSIAKNLASTSVVSSPTFTIINEYDIMLDNKESTLRHVDLYRLESVYEAYNIGLLETMYEDGLTFVEWGSKFIELFERYYLIDISYVDEDIREYKISKISKCD